MEELISKKELLEKYGISYGALYRWKRMGLIPEDWFEKTSTCNKDCTRCGYCASVKEKVFVNSEM